MIENNYEEMEGKRFHVVNNNKFSIIESENIKKDVAVPQFLFLFLIDGILEIHDKILYYVKEEGNWLKKKKVYYNIYFPSGTVLQEISNNKEQKNRKEIEKLRQELQQLNNKIEDLESQL